MTPYNLLQVLCSVGSLPARMALALCAPCEQTQRMPRRTVIIIVIMITLVTGLLDAVANLVSAISPR